MTIFRLILPAIFISSFSGRPIPVVPEPPVIVHLNEVQNLRLEDDEFIPWVDQRKLAWEDFHSKPEKHGDAVASTSTSLGLTYKVDLSTWAYTIISNFSKKKSWGLLKTDYILAHEQAHFDVNEIFARKLHQALSEYTFDSKTFKQDINNIYKSIVKEKEDFQEAYDKETDHSRNRKMQQAWLDKIDDILLELEPYSEYP